MVQPSKQAAVALKAAWKCVPRDRYAISAQTLSKVDRGRQKCLWGVGGSGFEGRGPGTKRCRLVDSDSRWGGRGSRLLSGLLSNRLVVVVPEQNQVLEAQECGRWGVQAVGGLSGATGAGLNLRLVGILGDDVESRASASVPRCSAVHRWRR